MSLSNKVAIITGSSSGIGAAIAEKFVEENAKVVIVGRNQSKLDNVEKKLQEKGGSVHVINADVTDENEANRIIKETIETFGQLDILVNNAGIVKTTGIESEETMDVFDKIMAVNLRSVVYLTHIAIPHLVETKGNIINISSVASLTVLDPLMFAYSTSKAALDHFSRCIALELAPKGIRVNCVNPGPVRTDVWENAGVDKDTLEDVWKMQQLRTALNRVGDAEEVADLVAFVASDRARSITGSTLVTDNGMVIKSSNSITTQI